MTVQRGLPAGKADVCVVGAGPVGIATAMACAQRGLNVLLLESGDAAQSQTSAALSTADVRDPARHAPMEVAACRALGGTSRWWGGRCVPFDDVDFEQRPGLRDGQWPIEHRDIAERYDEASDFLGCGPASFSANAEGWTTFDQATGDRLERWVPEIDIARRHRPTLDTSDRIAVVLNATVTDLVIRAERDSVDGLSVVVAGERKIVRADSYVIACGGLETTRLLLIAQSRHPALFGGTAGPLGRFYMGHISGKIADLELAAADQVALHDFFLDDGVYVRRRLMVNGGQQRDEGLLNAAFWLDNPPFHSAEHGSGLLSAVWLALAVPPVGRTLVSEGVRRSHLGPRPYNFSGHIRNSLTQIPSTARSAATIFKERYLANPRKPAFLMRNPGGRYALHYHAEQAPRADSRVRLGDNKDAFGCARLIIDFRYGQADVDSVVRSHDLVDHSLRSAGLGRLAYRTRDRHEAVWSQASDGFHQIGTTRMGFTRRDSVVGPNCEVHDLPNLFVASSSVFRSSGQANPTLPAVALGIRLAEHLGAMQRNPVVRVQESGAVG